MRPSHRQYPRQNRVKDALEWADAALKIDPQNAEANRVLGFVHASLAGLDDESAREDAAALEHARTAARALDAARRKAVSPEPRLLMMLGRGSSGIETSPPPL